MQLYLRLFNVTQIILKIGVTTIFASLRWIIEILYRFMHCQHTTGMFENHDRDMV